MYWSSYEPEWLVARRRDIASARVPTWCIFDNTAAGAAFDNARALSASTTDTVVE